MEWLIVLIILASFGFLVLFPWNFLFAQSVAIGFYCSLVYAIDYSIEYTFYFWLVWYSAALLTAITKEKAKQANPREKGPNSDEQQNIENMHNHNVFSFYAASASRRNVENEESE